MRASYFQEGNHLKKVWDLTIYEKDASDCWNVIIDAQSGELLRKYNWVQHCSFNAERDCEHAHVSTTIDEDEFSFSSSIYRRNEIMVYDKFSSKFYFLTTHLQI